MTDDTVLDAAQEVHKIRTRSMVETGVIELIGINEQVDENDYGGSVEVALGATVSGEILGAQFISTEDGSGSVGTPAGILLVLSADPAVSPGDTALGAANWPAIIGQIAVATADWISDTSGGGAYIVAKPVAFHALPSLFLVWFHTDATSFNDGEGDDEQLEVNLWIRRDS